MRWFLRFLILVNLQAFSQGIPTPVKTVVVFMENSSFEDVTDSANAPFIYSLLKDSTTAVFSNCYAETHPSQPNYIRFFSGHTMGVSNNGVPNDTPFIADNLGAQLLRNHYTFLGYSEGLPYVGFKGEFNGNYVRRHAPWVNWIGGSSDSSLPASVHKPYSEFPKDFNLLPTVSIIIPDLVNDMHNPADNRPIAIKNGDEWLKKNLKSYIDWAKDHSSLFILTWDEDDFSEKNRILSLFKGPMVKGGTYSKFVNHYNILKLIEQMYGLNQLGHSDTASSIDYCWKAFLGNEFQNVPVLFYPNPVYDHINLRISSKVEGAGQIVVFTSEGALIYKSTISFSHGQTIAEIDCSRWKSGSYTVKVEIGERTFVQKVLKN